MSMAVAITVFWSVKPCGMASGEQWISKTYQTIRHCISEYPNLHESWEYSFGLALNTF